MSILSKNDIKRKTLLLFAFEVTIAWLIHLFFSKPSTSIIGAPLLYPNGGRNLQIQIFIGINFIVIPLYYAKNLKILINILENLKKRKNSYPKFNTPLLMSLVSIFYFVFTTTTSFGQQFNRPIIKLIFLCLILGSLVYLKRIIKTLLEFINLLSQNEHSAVFSLLIVFISLAIKYYDTGTRLSLFFVLSALIAFLLFKYLQKSSLFKEKKQYFNELVFLGISTLMLYSRKNGALNLHAFEDFRYVNAKLMREGYLPWKSFSLEHGIWEDGLRQFFGGYVSQNTFWGQATGVAAVIHPLEIFVLLICIYAVSRKFLFTLIVLSCSFILDNVFQISFTNFPRIIPAVVITVLLKNFEQDNKSCKAIIIGLASGLGILWSPEYVYFLFGVYVVFGLNRKISIIQRIRILTIITSSFLATIYIILGSTGLLKYWVKSFLSDSSGYLLAWGAPFQFSLGLVYVLFFFLIPIFCISFFTYISYSYKSENNKISYLWLLPIVVTLAAYYLKFLQWPDGHIGQPITLILIIAIIFLGLSNKKWMLNQKFAYLGLIFALAITILAQTNENIYPINNTQRIAEIGFVDNPTYAYASRINEVSKDFSSVIGGQQNSHLFDFGNEPVTWYGLMDFKPVGNTTKVLNLYSSEAQKNVVRNLKTHAPKYVVWGGEYGYWQWPFSGNWMKQYLISEYILDNYQPVKQNGGYLLMLRNNYATASVRENNSKFLKSVDCNWYLGATRFDAPKNYTTFQEIKPLNSTNYEDQKVLTFNSEFTKFGLGVQTDRSTNVVIQQKDLNSGKIIFTIDPSDSPKQIWLSGCPAWRTQNSKTAWSISIPNNVNLKVFNLIN
jgi:hypothetical protein